MGRYGPDRLEEENLPYFYNYSVGERQLISLITSLVLYQQKIAAAIIVMERKVDNLMTAIDDLNTAVDKLTAAVGVAISDIQTISQELLNAQGDPAAVNAAVAKLNTLSDNLSAATPSPG